jgi:GNAT superfamily N-acetyltransferase
VRTDPRYQIRLARAADVAALPGIERAAGELFRGHVPEALLDDVFDEDEHEQARAEGRLWVAAHGETPVGFAVAELLAPGVAHLEEVDVLPAHHRRGLGARLVREVCAWAARGGHRELTLTTFRDLPWNMPFYARLGFVEVPPAELHPEVAAVFRAEAARGLDPARRVVMRRALERVRLRPTGDADLDFVLALERAPENAGFVGQWSREEHQAAIARPDREHWIIERDADGTREGFVIAYDGVSRGFGVYVKRIVVDEKSRGLGREALAQLLAHAKRDLGAPFAWLNVAADNARGIRAYTALGFRALTREQLGVLASAEEGGDLNERRVVMRIELR